MIRDNIKTVQDLQNAYKFIINILEEKRQSYREFSNTYKETSIRIECLNQIIKDLELIKQWFKMKILGTNRLTLD